MKQCFFGEHLLSKNPTKSVAIVESEKSALIAAHYMPDFIWLATGGMHGCFKADVISILKGRSIMLCPDLGAKEVWLDIADFLLMVETPAMILQKMIKRNPNLQTLIDCLHLELVDSS